MAFHDVLKEKETAEALTVRFLRKEYIKHKLKFKYIPTIA
jgi:hypothetical protein